MRTLTLAKAGLNKLRSHQLELKASDFDDSVKPLPPGEWCFFTSTSGECWVGFVNPLIDEKFACAHVLEALPSGAVGTFSPEVFIRGRLVRAFERRRRFTGYEANARMFYGASDGLPGLLVDVFSNAAIIQINTAGIDRYRELIRPVVEELASVEGFFLDNPKYREKESLPTYSERAFPELAVQENGLRFQIRPEVLQKVGFYYDHRENRLHLMNFLGRLAKRPARALDLFSYAGAWGLSALRSGVDEAVFVDQGDFGVEVEAALRLNGLEGKGRFVRGDVFRFLDDSLKENQRFDLILCDPPAFAKSSLQKHQALDGYSKLHRKVLRMLSSGGLVAFSSCTQCVGHAEFQKNIAEAAQKEGRSLQLVYAGLQGFDHPVPSLEDRANYIKSYFYIVE